MHGQIIGKVQVNSNRYSFLILLNNTIHILYPHIVSENFCEKQVLLTTTATKSQSVKCNIAKHKYQRRRLERIGDNVFQTSLCLCLVINL